MKNVTVKINKRNLNAIVRNNNFKVSGGMFNPYQFLAIDFEVDKNNTAKFYESTQVSQNSWINYPGVKIWNNSQNDWTKAEVIKEIEENLCEIKRELEYYSPNINFEFIGFENE